MSKIYVASSWRNLDQPNVVSSLRIAGHDVYDFRHPGIDNNGFHWSDIDPNWKTWTMNEYVKCLSHPIVNNGFELDFQAMKWAETFVGVMPFGRSASLEMGWAAGNGKKTILLLSDAEPELMVKMLDHVCTNIGEVLEILEDSK